jgi:hypothetical protein
MPLNKDRSINRAMVVGCAISATRNYLKLHMLKTLGLREVVWAILSQIQGQKAHG